MKNPLDQQVTQPDPRLETSPDTTDGKKYGGPKVVIAQGNRSYNQWNDDPSVEDENKASDALPMTIPKKGLAQVITFGALSAMVVGDADKTPGATSNSGLAITYTSANAAIATIVAGKIHAVGAGTVNITASQAGDDDYNAATPVVQPITITTP